MVGARRFTFFSAAWLGGLCALVIVVLVACFAPWPASLVRRTSGGVLFKEIREAVRSRAVTGAGEEADNSERLYGASCFTDYDCCHLAVGGLCSLFCKESATPDIGARSVEPWRPKGECTRKWEGWCTGDEECPHTFSCRRSRGDSPGTCTRASQHRVGHPFLATSPGWSETDSSPKRDQRPRGFWAWPQVAMYQILIDRFATPNATPCKKLDDYCGGTLPGVRARLWYLEKLGVDGVDLSPVVAQMPHGYHGYWTKDLTSVNPEFGTEQDLRELVVLLHEREMKVIVDVNLNHAGSPDTDSSDPESVSELKPLDKPEFYHDDNCSWTLGEDDAEGARFLERCKFYGMPDYNHESPKVQQHLMRWLREDVDVYGFDGIRVGAARHIDRSFLKRVEETAPPIPALFEVVSPDMSYVAGYATGDYSAVDNYPLYFMLRGIFVPGPDQSPMSALAEYFAETAHKAGGRLLLNFVDNNGLPRFIDELGGDRLLYHNALLCALGVEGLPTLLYGDEQDLRGVFDLSEPLEVDNWRPPLWHQGYNTSGDTFQLIQKVLWLRRRLNGLHEYEQRSVYADHRVMLFSRGPIVFAVTNTGAKSSVQPKIGHNARASWPYAKPAWVCNLLAIDPNKDCHVVLPDSTMRLHLHGEPKVYVPSEFVAEFAAHERNQQRDVLRQQASAPNPEVLPFSRWHEIPNPPTIRPLALTRTPRARLPADVVMHDNPYHVWHPLPKLPPRLDVWAPPIGVPAPHVVQASLADACFYLGAGEWDGAVFVQRDNMTYVLCADSQSSCPRAFDQNVSLERLQDVEALTAAPQRSVPVLHLTFHTWYGVYHFLVQALPSIAPHLRQLQTGAINVFSHGGQEIVRAVFSYLGISKSAFFPPADSPLAEPYHFCTSRMYFDFRTRSGDYVASYLHTLRRAMQVDSGPPPPWRQELQGDVVRQPGAGAARDLVILSRGNGSRSLRNEPELAAALESLGHPVRIVKPEPRNFLQMVEALSRAQVVVGAHGANLANIIFAPAGVRVFEIVPQVSFEFLNYHFRDLAGALNLTYVAVGQRVPEADINQTLAASSMTRDRAVASYEVDVARVTEFVRQALQ